jgi:hypothetical protein
VKSRLDSAQSLIIEVTDEEVVVKVKAVQQGQIHYPARNGSGQLVPRNEEFSQHLEVTILIR